MDNLIISLLADLKLADNAIQKIQGEANKHKIKLSVDLDTKTIENKLKNAIGGSNAQVKVNLDTNASSVTKELKEGVAGYIDSLEAAKQKTREFAKAQGEIQGSISKLSSTAIYDKDGKATKDATVTLDLYNDTLKKSTQLKFQYEEASGKIIQTGAKETENIKQRTEALKREDRQRVNAINSQKQLESMYARMLTRNDKITTDSDLYGRVRAEMSHLKSLDVETMDIKELDLELKKARGTHRSFVTEATQKGLAGKTFASEFKAQVHKLGIYLSGAAVAMGVKRQLQEMVRSVVELDGVLVDLQIATGQTREETKKLVATYSELGKELGATTMDVGKAADDWLNFRSEAQKCVF